MWWYVQVVGVCVCVAVLFVEYILPLCCLSVIDTSGNDSLNMQMKKRYLFSGVRQICLISVTEEFRRDRRSEDVCKDKACQHVRFHSQ